MATERLVMAVSVTDMPEVLSTLRFEMAKILRQHADAEASEYVKERMHKAADQFEVGFVGESDGN